MAKEGADRRLGEERLAHNRNFRRLWSAQILSQIAQNLLNFALIIRVFDLAQGTRVANIAVALVILAFGIPSIFFAAAAGVYIDHWNRKKVLVITNALRGILVLGFPFVEHNLFLLLLLCFIIASITQFFAPAEAASLPKIVREKDLLRANSLFIFTMYASFIVGYSGSAPVITAFGNQGPYFVTAFMFALATVLVSLLPTIKAEKNTEVPFKEVIRTTQSEIRSNFRIIRGNRNLSYPILQLTLTQATIGVLIALAPALSLALLHEPLKNASHVLIIPAGIGLVSGIATVGYIASKITKVRLMAIGFIFAASSLMLLGLTGALNKHVHGHQLASGPVVALIVATLVLILGFMNALISSSAQTILQENTTDESRGKVFGALGMAINIAATLPILFAGILASLSSVTKVIFGIGLGLLLYGIYQFATVRKHELLEHETPVPAEI
jgi:MFS family permease